MNYNKNFSAYAISDIIDIETLANNGYRPYGGLEILWSKKKSIYVKIIDADYSLRCLAKEITTGNSVHLCIAVFLPFYVSVDIYEEDILLLGGNQSVLRFNARGKMISSMAIVSVTEGCDCYCVINKSVFIHC